MTIAKMAIVAARFMLLGRRSRQNALRSAWPLASQMKSRCKSETTAPSNSGPRLVLTVVGGKAAGSVDHIVGHLVGAGYLG